MDHNKLSMNSIIEDYIALTGNTKIEPNQLKRFGNNVLDRILPGEQFVQNLVLLEVEDYRAAIPTSLRYIQQAAYLDQSEDDKYVTREVVTQYAKKIYGSDCKLTVDVKCDPCSTLDPCKSEVLTLNTDRVWDIANPNYSYEHVTGYIGGNSLSNSSHGGSCPSTLHPKFKLMRRTSNYYHNIPYHINECINVNVDSMVEYDINHPNIIVNFKKGQILLSFLGADTDENGYLMIPNVPIVYEAIIQGIEERLAYIDYRKSKEQKDRIFWQQALELKEKMVKRARSYLSTPSPDEWEMFIRNHWIKRVPNYKWEASHNKYTPDTRLKGQTYNTGRAV